MYVFKILQKTLAQEKLEVKNKLDKNISSVKKQESSPNKKSGPNFSSKGKTKNIAYCLFANSGESILAFYNDEKVTIFLNEISHPNKNNPTSKLANDFINEKIKKKSIFLDIIEKKENGDLIANIFLDPKQEQCLNTMLKDEELSTSNAMVTDKNEHHYSNNFSDMKVIHEEKIDTPPVSSTLKNENNANKNLDHLVGTLKNWGWAPFLNKPSNSKSFFITLEQDGVEQTKWGIDLERALTFSKANREDYIEINKEKTENKTTYSSNGQAKTSQKHTWTIKKLNNSIENSIPSPSLNSVILADNILDTYPDVPENFDISSFKIETENEFEDIPNWVVDDNNLELELDNFIDNQIPISLEDVEKNYKENLESNLDENHIEATPIVQSASYDLMDDILSSLDETDNTTDNTLDKKRNLKL